jgi:hypothetical protein
MKSALFTFVAFVIGFAGTIGLRIALPAQAKSVPAAVPASVGPGQVTPPDGFQQTLEAKLAAARAVDGPYSAKRELQQMIERWMRADLMECMKWLSDHGALGLVPREVLGDVFAGAFHGDLQLAIQHANQLTDARLRYDWISEGFREAAESNPAQAFELLRYLPTQQRGDIGREIVVNLAKANPASAWEAVLASRDSWYREGSARWQNHYMWAGDVLQIWAESRPQELEQFLRGKIAAQQADRESLILAQAMQDLATGNGADVVLSALAGLERNAITQNMWILAMEKASPEQALQAVAAEPAGPRRDNASMNAAFGVISKDPGRALQMVETLPESSARENALENLLKQQAGRDPAGAAAKAISLENPLTRWNAMSKVANTWLQNDAAGFCRQALDSPDSSAAWLDVMAGIMSNRANDSTSRAWIGKLEEQTRERLGSALQSRLTEQAWGGIAELFAAAR